MDFGNTRIDLGPCDGRGNDAVLRAVEDYGGNFCNGVKRLCCHCAHENAVAEDETGVCRASEVCWDPKGCHGTDEVKKEVGNSARVEVVCRCEGEFRVSLDPPS